MLPILPGIAETFGVNLRSDPTLLRAQILDLPLQLLERRPRHEDHLLV